MCWHIPIQSNRVVFPWIPSPHGSLGLVNLRHTQVFEKYHMPTTKPFLDPWPWLGHPDIHNGDWQRLTIFSTKLVLSWWRRSMWQTHQVWLQKTCLRIESAQKLDFRALPICFCSVSCLHEYLANLLTLVTHIHMTIWVHSSVTVFYDIVSCNTYPCMYLTKNQYKMPKFQQQKKYTFSHLNTTCYYFKWLQTLT